jgi:hypothetical protein
MAITQAKIGRLMKNVAMERLLYFVTGAGCLAAEGAAGGAPDAAKGHRLDRGTGTGLLDPFQNHTITWFQAIGYQPVFANSPHHLDQTWLHFVFSPHHHYHRFTLGVAGYTTLRHQDCLFAQPLPPARLAQTYRATTPVWGWERLPAG